MSSGSQTFQRASAYLSSYQGSMGNSTRLELYGLFKYVTVGPKPDGPRPGLFDMKGKAKWNSWESTGKQYQKPEDAEARYIVIAKENGWNEAQPNSINVPPAPKTSVLAREEGIEEDIWDENPAPRKAGAGQGLGVGVSVVSREDEGTPGSGGESSDLHSLVVNGDAAKVKALIESNARLDLNATDEYGYTPLHLASDRGHIEVVKLLLEKGADKSIKDPDDFTPKALAEIAGNKEIAELL